MTFARRSLKFSSWCEKRKSWNVERGGKKINKFHHLIQCISYSSCRMIKESIKNARRAKNIHEDYKKCCCIAPASSTYEKYVALPWNEWSMFSNKKDFMLKRKIPRLIKVIDREWLIRWKWCGRLEDEKWSMNEACENSEDTLGVRGVENYQKIYFSTKF